MISSKEIKAIKPGKKKTFNVSHPYEFQRARVCASYTGINNPECGVKYKVSINREAMTVTIEAKKVEV